MSDKQSHQWSPIEDLPEDWRSLANPQVEALVSAWLSQADDLRRGASYTNFLVKMRREWAIETGVIERLYFISDGATKTLIEQGLDAALLLHEDVNRSPGEVVAIINDQYNAIVGLYQFVSGDRELGKSYIKELHQVLTAHQPTYEAIDTLGNHVVRELPRGIWKSLPNNVGNSKDGCYFEFCPPEHVDAEIERLLRLHGEHEKNEVPPDLEAAWLHHRFTLIHPFTDGNGRVARCLASLVLLKANWFPLVVTRRDDGYIEALRDADRCNLKPLVDLFGALQSRAVTKAFSLSEELNRGTRTIGTILDAVREKFEKTRLQDDPEKQKVIAIGDAILNVASVRSEELAREIDNVINRFGSTYKAQSFVEDRHVIGLGLRREKIGEVARRLEYQPNFETFQAYVWIYIESQFSSSIFISIHGIGREFSGILAVTCFFDSSQPREESTIYNNLKPLSDAPFLFTYAEAEHDVIERFRPWFEERLILGLDHWRKAVGA